MSLKLCEFFAYLHFCSPTFFSYMAVVVLHSKPPLQKLCHDGIGLEEMIEFLIELLILPETQKLGLYKRVFYLGQNSWVGQ